MSTLLFLTESGTEEEVVVNIENVDVVKNSPGGGARLYFLYMDNPLQAEFVDVVESTGEIIDRLEELLGEDSGEEENFECGNPL
jgi:hypothetical protein